MYQQAKTAREFLNLVISQMEKTHGRGVKASISRKAGFSSRSFLSEVLAGKKGLSRDSMLRLKTALKLMGPTGKLFELLAVQSNPEINFQLDKKKLEQKILDTRTELKNVADASKKHFKPDLSRPEFFQIYAALGSPQRGASIDEVCFRTGLATRSTQKALKFMAANGLVEYRENRFFAIVSQVDELNSNDDFAISEMIKNVCSSLHKNRSAIAKDKINLNVYSAFSIRRSDLPKFKLTLQKAVFDVLDEFQDDDGDCVEQLFLSCFRNPLEMRIHP